MTSTSVQHTGTIGTVSDRGIPDEVDVVVVGSGGALTGYHWGLPRKRAILGWECGVAGRAHKA